MADTDSTKKNMSRQKLRDLDIEIGFLEGVVKRDRRNVEALQLLGDDYTQRGRYEEGLKIDRRLARLCPGDSLVQYNLACSFSLTAEYRKAANALRKALHYGYRDFDFLKTDPDLEPLRQQPIYAKLEKEIAGFEADDAGEV